MKKILQTTILVALIFLSINASAKSKLSISTSMQTAMKVIIDGQKFYSQDNKISINNLQPGFHNITVYYIKNGRDFNSYYNNGSNGYWKKAVSRQVTVRNNYQYDITINRFGRAFYDQDYYYGNNDWDSNNDDDNSYNDFDYNNGYDENYDDWNYFKRGAKQINTNHNNDNANNDNRNNQNGYSNLPVMNNTMFAQVKQTIQQQSFSSSKLEFAKQSIDKNAITTAQAKELMNMLTMQSDKLEFAKYAYDKVSDKNQYFTVANSLSMQSDKDDLLKYIRDKK